jgi:hypothetical protein
LAVLTQTPILFLSSLRRSKAAVLSLFLLGFLPFSAGCGRFHHEHHEMVYVSARQMYLRDRVAVVSNRVAEVANGQPLEVLEHGRRFLKVKTAKNEIGWIEERAVIDGKDFQAFGQLASRHKEDPVVATGILRDDIYLHLTPGREMQRFYLLPENAKVQLLERASIPKAAPGASGWGSKPSSPRPATAAKTSSQAPASKLAAKPVTATAAAAPSPGSSAAELPHLEDWWLVRDGQGHTGWLLARGVDVDVPDAIGVYGEGQRFVGVYMLNKVTDPEASTPDHEVPQYVTVLSPPSAGLPFDFDQVRVFTWSLRHHRYETAFRLHPIEGYLPVRVTSASGGNPPVFSFQIANGSNLTTDPETGITRPAALRTVTFELIDTQVKRTGSDLGPIPVSHLEGEKPKSSKPAKNHRK